MSQSALRRFDQPFVRDPTRENTIYDSKSNQSIFYYEDFLGPVFTVPVAGEGGLGWAALVVDTAGDATPTIVADGNGGLLECALTADSEAQTSAFFHLDNLNFNILEGLFFETRINVTVLPTDVAEIVIGVGDDNSNVPDTMTNSAFFTLDGGADLICETDDGTTDASTDSSEDVATGAFHIYGIDFREVDDIKFYYDGRRMLPNTTFGMVSSGVEAHVQPFIGLYKASGAGVGTIRIDYVKLWQDRL